MQGKHILVTGSHRSGTTWVGATIARHRRISYLHEPFNVGNPNPFFGYKFNTWFYYVQGTDQEEKIYNSFSRLFNPISSPFWRAVNGCRYNKLDALTPLRFSKHLMTGILSPKRILIKDPIAIMSAEWLCNKFDLQVICMIRNPLAFCGSLKKANWGFPFKQLYKQKHLVSNYLSEFEEVLKVYSTEPHDIIDQACQIWNIIYFVVSQYKRTHPDWFFIRHEDLVQNPIDGFKRILDYIGLSINPEIEASIEKHTSSSNPIESDSKFWGFQSINAKGSLTTWKSLLNSSEIERVISQTKNFADDFYQLRDGEFI